MTPRRSSAAILLGLVLLGAGTSGCSTGQPAVCDDVKALQESVDNIKNAQLGESGLSTVTTEVASMQTELRQLTADASAQYSEEVGAVKSSVAALSSSIGAAATAPSGTALGKVRDDIRALSTAVGDLSTAVSGTC